MQLLSQQDFSSLLMRYSTTVILVLPEPGHPLQSALWSASQIHPDIGCGFVVLTSYRDNFLSLKERPISPTLFMYDSTGRATGTSKISGVDILTKAFRVIKSKMEPPAYTPPSYAPETWPKPTATPEAPINYGQLNQMIQIFSMMAAMGYLNLDDRHPQEQVLPNGDKIIPLSDGRYGLIRAQKK